MDEFEARLREFTPRRPGPLPRPSKARPAVWLAGAIAAAAVAVVIVVGRNVGSRGQTVAAQDAGSAAGVGRDFSPARSAPTIGALTPLALNNPSALDAALTRMSQDLFPDVGQPNRALSALGRDSR